MIAASSSRDPAERSCILSAVVHPQPTLLSPFASGGEEFPAVPEPPSPMPPVPGTAPPVPPELPWLPPLEAVAPPVPIDAPPVPTDVPPVPPAPAPPLLVVDPP